jgi:hypothetical protein
MAIANVTLVTTPNLLSPVNDIWGNYYYLSSAQSSLTNFKYLTRLQAFNNFSAYIVTESQPPRPTTGYGLYSPYKTLLTGLSYDINLRLTGATTCPNSLTNYRINYGLEYNPGLTISSVLQVLPGNNFGFSCSSTTNLVVGDLITIQSQNPYYNGQSTIIQILGSSSFATNLTFTTASNVSTGNITDVQRYITNSNIYWAYNGVRQYGNQNINYFNLIVQGLVPGVTSSTQFLTDYPTTSATNAKYILPNQQENLSVFLQNVGFSYSSGFVKYTYYNSTGATLSTNSVTFSTVNAGDVQRWDIPVGTNYISTLPSYPLTTSYYSVQLHRSAAPSIRYSEIRYFYIDTSCSLYTNVRVMWLNTYGAFDYFNFRLDDKQTYNIVRNEYKQELSPTYNTGDRQRTALSQKVTEQHTINTNFISEDNYAFLGNLFTSPEVYIVDETSLLAYPIIIVDSSYEFKTANRDKLFNLTITYETSYDYETQNQ